MTADAPNHRSLILAEACAPETSRERLLELVGMNDPEIAAAVASHPGLSPELVENLLPLFPDRILANPAIDTIDRADPQFWPRMWSTHSHLLTHGHFTSAWRDRLLRDPQPQVRSAIATNPTLNPAQIEYCLQSEDHHLREGVVANLALSLPQLVDLSYDPLPAVRVNVARRAQGEGDILERLARDSQGEVRAAVAANAWATPALLFTLASDPLVEVRRQVAANPHSSLGTLQQLAKETDPEIVAALAQHEQADTNVLAALATQASWPVRTFLAQNTKTPVATLIVLAEAIDQDDGLDSFPMRMALVANPNAPDFLLGRCLLPADSPSRREQLLLHLSEHLNTPDEILDQMADQDNLTIQERLVNHPHVHHPTLVKLAGSKSWPIQQRALERINSSPVTIDRQTYIAEAEASVSKGEWKSIQDFNSQDLAGDLSPQRLDQPTAEITLLLDEEVYVEPAPLPIASSMAWDTRGEITKTGWSQLYDRTGEHLSAMHPLVLLLTLLALVCAGLGLTLWVRSTTPETLLPARTGASPLPTPLPNGMATSTARPKIIDGNTKYSQAISLANAATIASQTAKTKADWQKIKGQWQQAIGLLQQIPATDAKYSEAQGRLSNYKNILQAANLRVDRLP